MPSRGRSTGLAGSSSFGNEPTQTRCAFSRRAWLRGKPNRSGFYLMLARGLEPSLVADKLGHAGPGFTLAVY